MRILLASDHAGFARKNEIAAWLKEFTTHEVLDLGPFDTESVDYPDLANKVCSLIPKNTNELNSLLAMPTVMGILICGSGQGMAMRANKFAHIKAALCWNEDSAVLAREHNDANILCLGARFCDQKLSIAIVSKFLCTSFAQGRHARRVVKMLSPV